MDNYRPISVLPVLLKVLEKVVHKQIYEYLETNNLLSPNQFGFRRSRSTQHVVTYFSDYVRKYVDAGNILEKFLLILRRPATQSTTDVFYPNSPVMEWKEKNSAGLKATYSIENSLYLWKIPLQRGNLPYAVCHRGQYLDCYCLYS